MSHTLHEIYAGTANPAVPGVDEKARAAALLADFQDKGILSDDQLKNIGAGIIRGVRDVGPIYWQLCASANLRGQAIAVARELTQKPAEIQTLQPK